MRELEYPFDGTTILRKKKRIKRELLEKETERIKVRIAVLGGSTTTDIVSTLELFLLNAGIEPQFYESEYDKYWEDAVFGNERLDEFQPEIVWIHMSFRNVKGFPEVSDSGEEIKAGQKQEYERLKAMWESIEKRYHAIIIQNNFERPVTNVMGNQDVADLSGFANYISGLNDRIYEYKRTHTNFYIFDVAGLAGEYGLRKWQDLRYWYLYKYALSMDAIPEFSYRLHSLICAIYGKSKKVLILDADNTLWGGVIGECGPEGIEIGLETSRGQAFLEWQTFVKQLQKRGVLLAIVSKNEPESVAQGLAHPDSVLHSEDFSGMKVNWEDKASNIQQLSVELNLGPDQMVFVDDNPAEREIVRRYLPAVTVLEADRPEEFILAVRDSGCFESVRYTQEDRDRTEMYLANRKREEQQKKFSNYEDYLLSLEMKAVIQKVLPVHYDRVVQLINKTNQFNLTTWRVTDEMWRQLAVRPEWICLEGSMSDKFGNNGIVSVLMAEAVDQTVHIRLLILSCRVFKRQMEYAMMDHLMDCCEKAGYEEIIGYYYPTKKNVLVSQFYKDMGFACIQTEPNGDSVWKINRKDYRKRNTVITVEEDTDA